jgi:hypothetical protein
MRFFLHLAGLLASASLSGCAGNGDGLDQNGDPISLGGGSSGPISADFDSIQDNVFTPICSKCHIGASAPEGLELDAAHSYDLLVDVPSVEEPDLERVKPGDPDESYMVRKIEGLAGIEGGQMPLGEPALPQATIDAIRQWIVNGAPKGSATAAAHAAFAVRAAVPLDSSMTQAPVRQIVVAFTQAVDATLINDTTVSLERIDPRARSTEDGEYETLESAAALTLKTNLALADHNPSVLIIRPFVPLAPGVYRVSLRGLRGGALADLSAHTLGGDVSWYFSVTAAP